MKAKEFIENWYGTPIPPDWDIEHEALANVTIIQLEDMLNQYARHVSKHAVGEERKRAGNSCRNAWDFRRTIDRFDSILTRINKLTEE